MDQLFILLVILCALGSGAIGGVFFAFSNFVMPALARLAPAEGIHAMQAINVTVLNRLFLGTFMGTGLASLAAIIVALLRWDGIGSLCAVLAGAAYVLGSILVTMRGNVPLNNALMRIAQADVLGECAHHRQSRRDDAVHPGLVVIDVREAAARGWLLQPRRRGGAGVRRAPRCRDELRLILHPMLPGTLVARQRRLVQRLSA